MVSISNRSSEARRKPGPKPGVNAGQRIRQLPILPDIVDWIREGFPAAEVARRIHANGFLEEVDFELLRQEVARYGKTALAPEETLPERTLSALQVRHVGALESAVGELSELGELYRVEKLLLCEATGIAPSPGTIGHEEYNPAQVALPSPGEGGMDGDTEPTQAGLTNPGVRPKTFRDVRELLAEMRQTLRTHGGLRERLGGLGGGSPDEQRASLEDRLNGVIKGRFAGRQDVQEALQDPRRRTKILGVLHKFLTSQRSQDAAAAALAGELVPMGRGEDD